MYRLMSNQYLPNGLGRPASTYYYFVNEKGQTIDKNTLKPYKGKQMKRYAMYIKGNAEAYLEVINGIDSIYGIIERKKQGIDCTEAESAEIKGWLRELKLPFEQPTLADVQFYFPQEYGEFLDEIELKEPI